MDATWAAPTSSRSWTLGEWLTYRLEHIVQPEREHNTYVKYESKVRLYLLPHLGKKPLVKLTPAQIRAFMAALTREKVGASARFEVLRVLRNVLNRAMREELVTRNVALLVDMPKVIRDRGTAWNAREAITFLRSVRATGSRRPASSSWSSGSAAVRCSGCAGRTSTSRPAASSR
ncbi:hypothetical protein AB0F03_12590 [Streptomyces sp. NPDC028722]|uniref:hypothetical protein n=1 Tax=Streptomyces sp. NPDC028722 TaxID=3155016 RepID=UPI0033EF1E6C